MPTFRLIRFESQSELSIGENESEIGIVKYLVLSNLTLIKEEDCEAKKTEKVFKLMPVGETVLAN